MALLNGLALGVALMGCALSATAIGQDTLIFCSEGSPEGFDPALYTSSTTFDASSHQIYDKLVQFKSGTTMTGAALAQRVDISDDGLEYTFILRAGVKFHSTPYFIPTRDLNADDVVFSFERQLLADNAYNQVSGGTWELFNGLSMPDLIESIEAVDDLTVKLRLTRPESPMMANLGLDFASIVSAEYAQALLEAGTPEKLNLQPIGTGPFKFVSYEQDVQIRFQAHEEYWAGKAAVDELIFSITPDNAIAYEKLKAGECHVLPYPNLADIDAMRADAELDVLEQAGLNIGYLAYNTTVPPYDNVNVRKALNMAIDKQAILDTVFGGMGKIAKNPIPPTVWSYNEQTVDDPYSPDIARDMLIAEGVENLKMQVWTNPVARSFNPNPQLMAEVIQSNLGEVGVDVEIVNYDRGEFLKLSKELDRSGAVLMGWTGDNGDPDNFLAVLLGCGAVGNANRAQWCHKPFDDLIQKARVVSDQGQRMQLYEQAQLVFKEQAPWATIAHSVVYKVVRKEVQGFQIDPFGGHVFYPVSLGE